MVAPPPMQCMITIDYYDGNRFLARQPRQSGSPSKTPPGATFTQQLRDAMQRKRASSRDICATQGRNTEAVGPRRAWTALRTGLPAAASGCSRERNSGNKSAIRQFGALMRPAVASHCGCRTPSEIGAAGAASPGISGLPLMSRRPETGATPARQVAVLRYLAGCDSQSVGRGIPSRRLSYENLPLKVGPILPLANRVGGCGDRLSLNFGSALPRGR